jgi:hypothetical protein
MAKKAMTSRAGGKGSECTARQTFVFVRPPGLTPRQHSSGGKDRLLGISKRGDAYLRSLLIHGARSVIRTAGQMEDRLSRWITALAARRHVNAAAAAPGHEGMTLGLACFREPTDQYVDRMLLHPFRKPLTPRTG